MYLLGEFAASDVYNLKPMGNFSHFGAETKWSLRAQANG